MRVSAAHLAMMLAVLTCAVESVVAQSARVDSLSRIAHGAAALSTQRLDAMIALSREWTYIRPERAASYGTRAIAMARSMSDPGREGRARLKTGMAMVVLGRRQEALRHFRLTMEAGTRRRDVSLVLLARAMHTQTAMPADEAMHPLRPEECDSLAATIRDPDERLAFLYAASQIAQTRGAIPIADAQYQQAHRIALQRGDSLMIALVRAGQTTAWRMLQRGEESAAALAEAMRIARRGGYTVIEAVCASARGTAFLDAAQYDSSRTWYARARELAEQSGYRRLAAGSILNLGILRKHQGDLTRALVLYDRALRAFEQLDDAESQAFILVHMGGIHEMLKHYDRALTCFTRSDALLREIPDSPYRGYPATLRGWTLYRMNRHAEARDALREGIALMEPHAPPAQMVHWRTLLGWVYTALGKPDSASLCLQRGLREAEAMGLPFTQADAHIGLAELTLQQGQPARAQEHAQAAQRLARQLGQAEQLRDASFFLRESSAARGDFRRAYDANLVYRRMKDSLVNLESQRSIAEITARYENELKTRQIARLEEAQERRDALALALAGGLILLLALAVLVVLRLHARRQEATLRAETAMLQERAALAEKHRLAAEEETREKERQRILTWSLLDAQEQERRRIANDLHDGLGQELVVIKNRAKLALRKQHNPDELERHLVQVTEMTDTAIETVRGIAYNLRPTELDRLGLAGTLRTLAARAATALPEGIETSIDPIDGLFTRETEMLMYRIVQEGLGNILRHARARRAVLQVSWRKDRTDILIADDGCGFEPSDGAAESPAGLGLRSMQERAAIVGGTFRLITAQGQGTRLHISIPFPPPGEAERLSDRTSVLPEPGTGNTSVLNAGAPMIALLATSMLAMTLLMTAVLTDSASAQTHRIDRLQRVLDGDPHDTVRVAVLSELCYLQKRSDANAAIRHGERAAALAREIGFRRGEVRARCELSWALLEAGRTSEAREQAAVALKTARGDRWADGLARAHDRMGMALSVEGALEEAEKHFLLADSISRRTSNDAVLVNVLINRGNVRMFRGQFEPARSLYLRAQRLARRIGDSLSLGTVHLNLGSASCAMGRFLEGRTEFLAALEILGRLDAPAGMATALHGIAMTYQFAGKLDSAKHFYEQALGHADRAGVLPVRAALMVNIGLIDMNHGRLEEALPRFITATELAEKTSNLRILADALHNTAVVHFLLRQYDRGMVYLRRSRALSERMGDMHSLAWSLQNIGLVHHFQHRPDSAKHYLHASLRLHRECGGPFDIASSLAGLGLVHLSAGDIDSAEAVFREAIRLGIAEGDPRMYVESQTGLARIHLLRGRLREAAATAREAYDGASGLGNAEILRDAAQVFAEARYATGDFRDAYRLQREYGRIKDSIDNRDSQRAIAEIMEGYEAEKKQRRILDLETAAAARDSLILGLGIAAFLLLTIAFLVVRHIRGRRRTATLQADAAEYRAKAATADAHRLAAENERREKELQRWTTRRLIETQEHERQHIAADLNDSLGKELTYIRDCAAVAMKKRRDSGTLQRQLLEVVDMTGSAMDTVRRIAYRLRPTELDRVGLTAALRTMLRKMDPALPDGITTYLEDLEGLFPPETDIMLYRIVQECVENVIRHADARGAAVRVRHEGDTVAIIIEDDGRGLPAGWERSVPIHGGMGLRGIRERTVMLGGTLTITSSPGDGTRLKIVLPVAASLESTVPG